MGIQKIFRTNFQVEGNYLFNKNIFLIILEYHSHFMSI